MAFGVDAQQCSAICNGHSIEDIEARAQSIAL
jgi:hypothetical protein